MSIFKFGKDDLVLNVLKTHPEYEVIIGAGKYYINNRTEHSASNDTETGTILERSVPQGHISLYELNINRKIDTGTGDEPWKNAKSIFPFVTKDGTGGSFKTISTSQFSSDFNYGQVIKSKYPLSASISSVFVTAVGSFGYDDPLTSLRNKKYLYALENTLNHYTYMSPHYQFTSTLGDKKTQDVGIIAIPSIFYGSKIKPGTVELKCYLTGAFVAKLEDIGRNGELVETTGSNVGKVAGVVLYNEGFFVLTGSWDIKTTHKESYGGSGNQSPKWKYFGIGLTSTGEEDPTSSLLGLPQHSIKTSWSFKFKGTNKIPTMTMFAHAKKEDLNYSNNPTFVDKTVRANRQNTITDNGFLERRNVIKNVTQSPYKDHSADFVKNTYISKIGIYDENYNLLGVATLANPVRKIEDRDFTFKLKLDF